MPLQYELRARPVSRISSAPRHYVVATSRPATGLTTCSDCACRAEDLFHAVSTVTLGLIQRLVCSPATAAPNWWTTLLPSLPYSQQRWLLREAAWDCLACDQFPDLISRSHGRCQIANPVSPAGTVLRRSSSVSFIFSIRGHLGFLQLGQFDC